MNQVLRSERRASPRKLWDECGWLLSARLRPGQDVSVLDLSTRGALVEGVVRLMPGASIELHLIGLDRRQTLRGRVVRCHVSALDPSGVRYRAALEFDRRVGQPILDEVPPAGVASHSGAAAGRGFTLREVFDPRFE
jgi:hypothetical protein